MELFRFQDGLKPDAADEEEIALRAGIREAFIHWTSDDDNGKRLRDIAFFLRRQILDASNSDALDKDDDTYFDFYETPNSIYSGLRESMYELFNEYQYTGLRAELDGGFYYPREEEHNLEPERRFRKSPDQNSREDSIAYYLDFIDDHKKLQKADGYLELLSSRNRQADARVDLGFFEDSSIADKLHALMEKSHTRAINYAVDMNESMDISTPSIDQAFSEFEEKLSGRKKLFGDSRYMDDIKKKLQAFRDVNAEDYADDSLRYAKMQRAREDLIRSCESYMETRAKSRTFSKGEDRKTYVADLLKSLKSDEAARECGRVPDQMLDLYMMGKQKLNYHELQEMKKAPTEDFLKAQQNAAGELRAATKRSLNYKQQMNQILTVCAEAMASIDVRAEFLQSIGVDTNHLSEDVLQMKMEEVTKARPDQVNDFLSSFSSWAADASHTLNSEPFGKRWKSLKENSKDGDNVFSKANRAELAMTKGLEAEVRWKNLREDYKNGYPADKTEAAALREAVAVQRSLIAKNGTLASQSTYTTENIRNIPQTMVELMTTEAAAGKEDFRDILKEQSMKSVMNGSDLGDRIRNLVPHAAKNHSGTYLEEQLVADGKLLDLKKPLTDTPLKTSNRPAHLYSRVMAAGLNQGETLDEIFSDPQSFHQASEQLAEFLREVPKADSTEKEGRETQQVFANFVYEAYKSLGSVKLPDLKAPIERAANMVKLVTLSQFDMELMDTYGKIKSCLTEEQRTEIGQIQNVIQLLSPLQSYDNPKVSACTRMSGVYVLSMDFLPQMSGRTISELAPCTADFTDPITKISQAGELLDYAGFDSEEIIAGHESFGMTEFDNVLEENDTFRCVLDLKNLNFAQLPPAKEKSEAKENTEAASSKKQISLEEVQRKENLESDKTRLSDSAGNKDKHLDTVRKRSNTTQRTSDKNQTPSHTGRYSL